MKKILVTGGSGFIGSHLCDFLIKKNNQVIVLDNNYSSKKSNIKHLLNKKNFKFLKRDVNQKLNINVDEIYHLACPASPKYYQLDPINTLKTNVMGTLNMLELADKNKCKILISSTSEIYGDPLLHPQNEKYWGNVNPIGPRACYDEGKRAAECLAFDFFRQKNTKIKIVRIFNTYGPRMDKSDGRVVSNLIMQALNAKEMSIYGDGSHTRSFCYYEDTVKGLYKMMSANSKFTGPVNIGNPSEISILELAKKIADIMNIKLKIKFLPLPIDDPYRRKPDISLAKNLLNWSPKVNLMTGLKSTINYLAEN